MQEKTVDIFIGLRASSVGFSLFSEWPRWSKLTLLFVGVALLITAVLLLLFLLVFPLINKFAGTDFPCRDFASVKRARAQVPPEPTDEAAASVAEQTVEPMQMPSKTTQPRTKSTKQTTAHDRVPTFVLPPVQEQHEMPRITQKSITQAAKTGNTTAQSVTTAAKNAQASRTKTGTEKTAERKKTAKTGKTTAKSTVKRAPSAKTTIQKSGERK